MHELRRGQAVPAAHYGLVHVLGLRGTDSLADLPAAAAILENASFADTLAFAGSFGWVKKPAGMKNYLLTLGESGFRIGSPLSFLPCSVVRALNFKNNQKVELL